MRALRLLALLVCSQATNADEPAPVAPNVPFRTDSANEHLPWYRLKAGEFPPHLSEHRVGGVLLEADFIHRSGQFRKDGTGELVDFTLPPFGVVRYLNAEADLRDVPLGTHLLFSLYQEETGDFTRAATLQDEFTTLARQGVTYRLDEVFSDQGRLVVTRQRLPQDQNDLGNGELHVDGQTRIWKGDKPAKLSDLATGDELLVNLSGGTPQGLGRCSDIWAGRQAHTLATENQRKTHAAFLKERGLPAWIDRVDGKKLTVTLFGDPDSMRALFKGEGIDPGRWAAERRRVDAVVANEELRTYNPPVDRRAALVLEFQEVPTDRHGCSGVRWVIEPDLLLEGFRKGRVIRLFAHSSWPVNDMPVGEGLYSEAPSARVEVEEPGQYPYRTDFANKHLPWFRLKPGEFPPSQSHHLVVGELVNVNVHHRSGRFRADRTGELVDWTMPPFGSVMALGAEADPRDLAAGTRYLFLLHQDDDRAFTRATIIMDEYTDFANDKQTFRLDEAKLGEGILLLSRLLAFVENEKGARIRPPALGRGGFAVDANTRVWKGGKPAQLRDLVAGDELLVNQSGRTATGRGVCTEIWAGAETHKLVTEQQRARHGASLKAHGLPAWIDGVQGTELTISLFSGSRRDFPALLNGDPGGDAVYTSLVDDELRPLDAIVDKMGYKGHPPEATPAGGVGSSGVRWIVESGQPPGRYRKGQILRVFKTGWPTKGNTARERAPDQ